MPDSTSEVPVLKAYKQRKKRKKMVEDIDMINKIFEMSQQALSHYKNYVAVQEVVSIMETNKTLFILQQNQIKKDLENEL